MTATVHGRGRYTLFETPRQNRILVLGDDQWFAWVGGQQGEILVRSDAQHERDRTIQEGQYYLVDFEGDPSFTDVPHLFLERNGEFQEVILPNGLPTVGDTQKRVVETEKTIARAELERHLGSGSGALSDSVTGSADSDRELPIPDFNELSVRGAKVRLDALNADELRRLRAYEAENKQRKTLIHEIDRRLRE
jgi:hypothetical protein